MGESTNSPSPLMGEGLPCGVEDFTPRGRGGGDKEMSPHLNPPPQETVS